MYMGFWNNLFSLPILCNVILVMVLENILSFIIIHWKETKLITLYFNTAKRFCWNE